MRCLIGVIRRIFGGSATAEQRAVCGSRQKILTATLTVIAATLMVFAAGVANIGQANAAPMCPGPLSNTGNNCCPAGSTPTGGDTCQLPGGGLAASCPLGQLTSDGTSCCPLSSTPQLDGTCQPSSSSASAQSCPLGQLNLGANATAGTWTGLSCCPSGFPPQADGSCAVTLVGPMPECPPGLDLVGGGGPSTPGQCNGASLPNTNNVPTCPPGSAANVTLAGNFLTIGNCVANPICPWPYFWTPGPNDIGNGQCISIVTPCPQSCVISTSAGQCVPGPGSSSETVCHGPPIGAPPWPSCPSGFTLVWTGGNPSMSCWAFSPACPVGTQAYAGLGPAAGCCPTSSPNCASPRAPSCPPGSTAVNYGTQLLGGNLDFVCQGQPQCPRFFRFSNYPNQCLLVFSFEQIETRVFLPGEVLNTGPPLPSPSPPASGPGQCPAGFVPREAYSGDRLCVNSGARGQTLLDNVAAPSRTKPDGTCIQGYVWRQAIPSDHVCVTPATRTQAQSDNRTGVQLQGPVQQQVAPLQPGFTPPLGTSGPTPPITHTPTNTPTPTITAPAPCQLGEVRTERGCEKEPTQSNPSVQTPSKVLTPPKPVTVQKPVPPPKLNIAKPLSPRLNIAKPPPPAPKLPSGPEDKQKR
jgi:hypothetical protein